MKILTLNIRQGGGTRIDKLVPRLLSTNVDTLVLTEFRENQHSVTIKNALIGAGYLWQASCLNEPNINSILIASKFEFENTYLDDLPQCCKSRALLVKFQNLTLLAVYFAQRNEKQVLFDYISDKCIHLLMPRGIVIGDFNTGKPYLDEPKRSFSCIDAFVNLESIGLIDSWRSRNLEGKEFSWYSNIGNGFRIDHIFSTTELDQSLKYIGYDHSPCIQQETDHSAMFVEFED